MGNRRVAPVTGLDVITADWLAAALDTEVAAVEARPVGTGQVADTYRLTITYGDGGDGPATVIAKVPSEDPTSRAAARRTRTYEIEATFYRDLAGDLAVRAPHCYYADHEVDSGGYVVLLEDVAPAEQGDQIAGLDEATIGEAVDELAHLHGPRWDDPSLRELDWLDRSSPENLAVTATLFTNCADPFLERYGDRLTDVAIAATKRLVPSIGEYILSRSGPRTVVHGDYRADNLLLGGDRVVVVDWQTVALGYPGGRPRLPARHQPAPAGPAPARGRADRPLPLGSAGPRGHRRARLGVDGVPPRRLRRAHHGRAGVDPRRPDRSR